MRVCVCVCVRERERERDRDRDILKNWINELSFVIVLTLRLN